MGMEIAWFYDERHLFNTMGELPIEGSAVYFRNYTDDDRGTQVVGYKVVRANHVVVQSSFSTEGMEVPAELDPLAKLAYICEKVERETKGKVNRAVEGGLIYIRHTGEVILEKITD